ncbi:MAG: FadR/GntR family transcriptional regulator [Alphaproteobacteria bacterium]
MSPAISAGELIGRTVIREAIAELRADGLVSSRHGVGVFVNEPRRPEGLALLSQVSDKVSDVIEELELRAAVEVEAAGLAAERCSPAQEADIQAQISEFAKLMRAGASTASADFAFHMAIARATNNARFEAFLAHLGRRTIPRTKLREIMVENGAKPNLDAQLQEEHRAVAEAIFDRDIALARDTMRTHLVGSLQRYRGMAREAARGASGSK